MKTCMFILAGLLAFAVTPVMADVDVGDEAPKIFAFDWYNLPSGVKELKSSHLKGQIVMLEFWGTSSRASVRSIPHLNELQEKYKSQGVVLVALSRESDSKVKPAIKKYKMGYVVGSGAAATQRAYGVSKFPTTFLIDPDGNVAWKGNPAVVEKELKKLLKDKPVRGKGFLAEKSAKSAYKKAVKHYDKSDYPKAMAAFEKVVREFNGTEAAKKARSKIKKMRRSSRIMNTIKREEADRISSGWLEVARMCTQYGDEEDALKYYDRIIKKYPGAENAKLARIERDIIDPPELEEEDEDEEEEDEDEDEDEEDEEEDDD